VDGQIAGFALVNRHTITGEDRRAIAEFFVMRKYRGRGAGRQAAGAIFDLWPGRWEVAPLAASPGAYAFWRKAVGDYTANDFEERRIDDGSCAGTVLLFSSRSGDR
jgi:predicted acetyltransferase